MSKIQDINNVNLVGRLVRDPEFQVTRNNKSLSKFSLAVNHKPNRDGEADVSYFNVVCFGKLAEIARDYLNKGSQVIVFGELKQNRWTNQDGQKRNSIDILCDKLQMVGNKSQGNNVEQNNRRTNNRRTNRTHQEQMDSFDYSDTGFNDTPMSFDDNDEFPF